MEIWTMFCRWNKWSRALAWTSWCASWRMSSSLILLRNLYFISSSAWQIFLNLNWNTSLFKLAGCCGYQIFRCFRHEINWYVFTTFWSRWGIPKNISLINLKHWCIFKHRDQHFKWLWTVSNLSTNMPSLVPENAKKISFLPSIK